MSIRKALAREWARADSDMKNFKDMCEGIGIYFLNCPNCGEKLAFKREHQRFLCEACGWNPWLKEPSDGNNGIIPKLEWKKEDFDDVKTFSCNYAYMTKCEDGRWHFVGNSGVLTHATTAEEGMVELEAYLRRLAKELLEKLGDEA